MTPLASSWVLYRQQRAQLLLTSVFVVLGTAYLVLFAVPGTGSGCSEYQNCPAAASELKQHYDEVAPLLPYLGLAPVVVGVFWGAPILAREYERGTAALAWTQSVTRASWLRQRFVILGSLVFVLGLVLGLAVSTWLRAFQGLDLPGVPPRTDLLMVRGIVPAFYWLTSFFIGLAWGALLRRVVPAMAATAGTMLAVTVLLNLAQNALFDLHSNDLLRSSIVVGALLGPLAISAAVICWKAVHKQPAS